MNQHSVLVDTFATYMDKLATIGDRLDWSTKEAYGSWLTQTYHYVSHSTRLLALSASRFDLNQNKLHTRFIEHLREEKGHEVLAVNDLKLIGKSINDFPEFTETSAFYKTQYYWVEHISPISFYGYILCLEGFAVHRGGHFFKKIIENFGEKHASFLKIHKDEDTGHLKKAFDQLKTLSDTDLKQITQNFIESCDLYGSILSRVHEVQSIKLKKAS